MSLAIFLLLATAPASADSNTAANYLKMDKEIFAREQKLLEKTDNEIAQIVDSSSCFNTSTHIDLMFQAMNIRASLAVAGANIEACEKDLKARKVKEAEKECKVAGDLLAKTLPLFAKRKHSIDELKCQKSASIDEGQGKQVQEVSKSDDISFSHEANSGQTSVK